MQIHWGVLRILPTTISLFFFLLIRLPQWMFLSTRLGFERSMKDPKHVWLHYQPGCPYGFDMVCQRCGKLQKTIWGSLFIYFPRNQPGRFENLYVKGHCTFHKFQEIMRHHTSNYPLTRGWGGRAVTKIHRIWWSMPMWFEVSWEEHTRNHIEHISQIQKP